MIMATACALEARGAISLAPRLQRLCENSGFSAPKARNVTAWAIGLGGVRLRFVALKARNESGTSEILNVFSRALLFRAFSASRICYDLYPGRCPGLSHSAPLALR